MPVFEFFWTVYPHCFLQPLGVLALDNLFSEVPCAVAARMQNGFRNAPKQNAMESRDELISKNL